MYVCSYAEFLPILAHLEEVVPGYVRPPHVGVKSSHLDQYGTKYRSSRNPVNNITIVVYVRDIFTNFDLYLT